MPTDPVSIQAEFHKAVIERLQTERDQLATTLRALVHNEIAPPGVAVEITMLLDGMNAPNQYNP